MKSNYLLDTSFIIALLNPLDSLHESAKKMLFDINSDDVRFTIPLICVTESIMKNKHPMEFVDLLRELLNGRDFEITIEDDLNTIIKFPLKTRSALKANDCIVMAMSKRCNAELFTLDKRLKKHYLKI